MQTAGFSSSFTSSVLGKTKCQTARGNVAADIISNSVMRTVRTELGK